MIDAEGDDIRDQKGGDASKQEQYEYQNEIVYPGMPSLQSIFSQIVIGDSRSHRGPHT